MLVLARPTGELLDELAKCSEAFDQPLETLLKESPLNVGFIWVLYERSGGLPAIHWNGALYCLPIDSVDDYRKHPFALLFTQAGQFAPMDAPRPLHEVEVKDKILSKLASIVGATSLIEAYGYSLWFFTRILNFAREHHPGGTPGVCSLKERTFQAFFGMKHARRGFQLIGWDECLAVTNDRLRRSGAIDAPPDGTELVYSFLEKLGQFQETVRKKDPWLASRITTVALDLLERKGPAARISEEELAGLGPKLAPYARRLFRGEGIESVVQDVPQRTSNRVPSPGDGGGKDRGNWDGSWDNVNRQYEGG